MKNEKQTAEKPTKAKQDKATSGGGKNKNDGGLTARELKVDGGGGKSGRSGGKGA